MAADNSTGGGFDWGGFFSAATGAATNIIKTLNTPTGTVYNPQAGQYVPVPGTQAAALNSLSSNAGMIMVLGFGLVAILLLRK